MSKDVKEVSHVSSCLGEAFQAEGKDPNMGVQLVCSRSSKNISPAGVEEARGGGQSSPDEGQPFLGGIRSHC